MISHNRKTIARTLGTDHDPCKGEPWQARAMCVGADPELWFPTGKHATDSPVWDDPRRICDICPVRDACLQDAIEDPEDPWGMRGGKTPDELAALRAKRCIDCETNPARPGRSYCTRCTTARRRNETRRFTTTECVDCHRDMRIKARGLCSACYKAWATSQRVAS